ncbi:MAG TPA: hypothetical protein PKJ15_06640, partial [Methanomassiliicoccales archaeon]|nr:hypothetical protein [Methanomassiliicoccales archaeon]
MTDDLINIALNYEPSDQIMFMQLAGNGTIVTSPSTICQTSDLVGIDLQMIDGALRLLIIEKGFVRLARCLGVPEYWSVCSLLEPEGTITGASMMVLDDNIRIAYAKDDGNKSTVLYLDCDLQGQTVRGPEAISTPGLNASSPLLLSTSPGVISCIYVEEHYDSQELFLKYDMDFVIPDIPRLKKFIRSLGEDTLSEGNISREKLIEKLDRIVAFLDNKNEAAAVEEALELKASIEVYFVYAPYADQETIQGSKDKIKKNLDTVKKDDAPDVIIMSPPPVPGFDVNLYEQYVTNNQAELRMYLVVSGTPISGYMMWGASSTLTNRVNCTSSGNTFIGVMANLNPNTTYYAKGYITASIFGGTSTKSSQTLIFKTFPSVLHIYSISVSVSSGSAVISWTTDGESNSRVDYGTTSSYGSYVSSSSYSYSHSLTLSNLASNTLYHYKI